MCTIVLKLLAQIQLEYLDSATRRKHALEKTTLTSPFFFNVWLKSFQVTKTRITKTFTHQVQVPAGTTLPPGAHLISSTTVEGLAPTIGNGQATYHYQETSSSSGYNGDGHSNNGSTGQHSAQYSAENGAEEQQQYNQFNQINNTINSQHGGGVVKTEPTVVVESTVDDNGRKVTKTTTTTSSSSSSGKPNSFSKFFKRVSRAEWTRCFSSKW